MCAVEAELLGRLRGAWGMCREVTRLCNLFLLGVPGVQGFADALVSGRTPHALSAPRVVGMLHDHLPTDQGWCRDEAEHAGQLLPDAHDVRGEAGPVESLAWVASGR